MIYVQCLCFFFFFFSSRRRHTRLQGDWSSDVCSSDLRLLLRAVDVEHQPHLHPARERVAHQLLHVRRGEVVDADEDRAARGDRKSTRLNSSHLVISYAVFCLKKKKIPDRTSVTARGETISD